jgi:hypothetical protein
MPAATDASAAREGERTVARRRFETPVMLVAVVSFAVSGCGRSDIEYQRQLPNGYRVQSDGDDRPLICAPSNIVVIPPTMSHATWQVLAIQVAGDVVIGDIELKGTSAVEWFVLDTKTGAVQIYKDEANWRQEARKRDMGTIALLPPHRL